MDPQEKQRKANVNNTLELLLATAVTIGFLHTLIGVDHTLPFVVLARAQKWSLQKLLVVTNLCGVGHVLSSLLLGWVGISLGTAIEQLELIETRRGQLAAWLLIGFGIAYVVWSVYRRPRRVSPGHHRLGHLVAAHLDLGERKSPSSPSQGLPKSTLTVWTLFIIFVFGPCEPLIPLLMAPAFEHHWLSVIGVALAFGFVTLSTMSILVTLGYYGLKVSPFLFLERHMHTACGVTIAATGCAIRVLGI